MSADNPVINDYIRKIEASMLRGDSTEHTHRPALKELLEALDPQITATNEPKRSEYGAPDFSISQKSRHGSTVIGYVEAKDVGKSLDEAEKTEQLKRYLLAFPNLILTDYLEFRWFINQKLIKSARLGWLTPKFKIQIDQSGVAEIHQILRGFLSRSPEKVYAAKELAVRLASLTQIVRDIIIKSFEDNNESKTMQSLLKAFRQTLLPELSGVDFADMFAQTLAYGLFAARQFNIGVSEFKRQQARHFIPRSTPFFRDFFDMVTGTKLDDEPFAEVVDEIVQLLRMSDMHTVMADFGSSEGRKDPIFHFYETFLAAYNPEERKRRGVYYTPESVVSYIVRSVDYVLKTSFKITRGLADGSKTAEKGGANNHKVLILDPACGTGTFLYHTIDYIREQYLRGRNQGAWHSYVHEHLLSRLFGFELQMAPYVVAHLKLGMELAGRDQPELFQDGLAYELEPSERINVFLTNTLEGAEHKIQQELYGYDFIAEEANAAIAVKKDLPIMVVLGNPPYSGHSANRAWDISDGKRVRTFIGQLLQDYYYVDGKPLGERNPKWLQDDYVKFIRWAQWRLEQTGSGVLAFITNHGYLDNPSFRGMRQQLMRVFDEIYLYDLHGSTKKKENTPDGSRDQNVFDIQQGVAIGIFIKTTKKEKNWPAVVRHAELWGSRNDKYELLHEKEIKNTKWKKLDPKSPFYLFVPQNTTLLKEYNQGWKIPEAMPVNSVGVVTARDSLVVKWSEKEMLDTVKRFVSLPVEEARIKYNLGKDANDWKVSLAQEDLGRNPIGMDYIKPILYRPFDTRYTYYTGQSSGFICRPRPEVMRHMLKETNMGVCMTRSVEIGRGFEHVFCSDKIIQHHTVSLKEVNYLFPLYLYPDTEKNGHLFSNGSSRHVNLSPDFIKGFEKRLNLSFISDGKGNLKKTFGPEDVFNYIYAVLHSPTYRSRYSEFLKADFPKVPITTDLKIFRGLSSKGASLVALHLMNSKLLDKRLTVFPESGSDIVEKGYPKYDEKKEIVEINKDQYFDGVPNKVHEFHIGGYKVCERWLKDRQGRKLTNDDINHYQKMIVSISETICIMKEIDEIIPSWPIT